MTFGGLLYIQIMYMRNMTKMRDDQFAEGVKRSLYAVTTALEQDEAKYFMEEDAAQIESSYYPGYSSNGQPVIGGIKYSFTTNEGVKGDLTLKGDLNALTLNQGMKGKQGMSRTTTHETLRAQYLYQRSLMNNVILNIISQSSNRPISERADSATVAGYIKRELDNVGLDLPFEFAIVNRAGALIYHSENYKTTDATSGSTFVQTLFPNDPRNKMNYLKVYFPTKDDYILRSIKFMIPSFAFTFILLVTFVYTIILAFRQKKLTEMKNDFINNMTHEFKTPISTISLAAQMLNDNSVRKSESMMKHISTVINDETKRLRFQVEKVLQMSMFDRQKTTMKLQEVDANVAIANIIHTFKIKIEKYGGRIEADLNAENAVVNVDEMHFTNVIFNLLDNAVKYRDEERALLLKVKTRMVHGGDRIAIEIGDNGIGIKKDDLKKIFEKFYRVSTGNRHDVKGFGLGLAYVHKIITELNGTIHAESEYGVGTKFTIILPTTK